MVKHHHMPLSGGDRKALTKELSRSRAMTGIRLVTLIRKPLQTHDIDFRRGCTTGPFALIATYAIRGASWQSTEQSQTKEGI